MNRYLLVTCASLLAGPLMAQVGVPPDRSPFRDLDKRMEFSFLSGYLNAGRDPVGIAPQSAPYVGLRYDYSVGSLVSLSARTALVPTKRNVIDPTLPAATRVIGETNQTLFLFDGGLTFNLTGARSFHNLIPVVGIGMGFGSDFQAKDAGGYALTPRFLLTLGAGVKMLLGNSLQLRADVTNYMLGIGYPDSYLVPASDGTAAREGDGSIYSSNVVLSLGLSYRFFR